MTINWDNIRDIDGQRNGFEELVCQLASQEDLPNREKFVRVGNPDGGKECYWKQKDGALHFWQAKYFRRSFQSSEWSQINKSVLDAINNHSNLVKYYVVVPVDRPDGHKGKSMLKKWEEHVNEWEKRATEKGMSVTFEFWGKFELETRLRKQENEGLRYYFFNHIEFTDDWFNRKNQESIDALGNRYTPELNFKLSITSTFDGLNRDEDFINQLNNYYAELLDSYRSFYIKSGKIDLDEHQGHLENKFTSFRSLYESIEFTGVEPIPFEILGGMLNQISDLISEIEQQLYVLRESIIKKKEKKGEKIDNYSQPFNNELYKLRDFEQKTYEFSSFINSNTCKLANQPYLILTGPAGIGKSHLLADIIRLRSQKNYSSLLLLGENFTTHELPWTQILNNHLRKQIDEDVFLGALNAKAESSQNRIVIFIDALNEGEGRVVWPKRLKSFIRSFQKYPWLGLVVSVRDSFEKLIVSNDKIIEENIALIQRHYGFEGVEYEASSHFFKYYEILPPGSPLLHPEFQNPLFLKLFCEGLAKRGLKKIPPGYEGITAIIEYFIESVEIKLSYPTQLDFDEKLKLVQNTVHKIVDELVKKNQNHLRYDEVEKIVSEEFSSKCGSTDKQYLKRLISEGVFNEDLYWDSEENYYSGIHFAYQRFQDHLYTSSLLDNHLDPENPEKSFEKNELKSLLADNQTAFYNKNLIEALSIQIPERVGKELHEVAIYASEYDATASAFIEGLIWRNPNTVGESAKEYVNTVLIKNADHFYRFLDVILATSTKSNFYFNSDRLHSFLSQFSLPKRDKIWTTWLQNKYGSYSGPNSVKRLIDWAWNEDEINHINDESIRLAAIALGWFLTSSNRYLRDGATKALICLLQDRLDVLIKVLQTFEDVNDPYVLERLYAVTCGCAIRTDEKNKLSSLCKYIYMSIFNVDQVCPHILLRDYARGVIEYAIYLGLRMDIDIDKIRPPYKSNLTDVFPTIEDIDQHYNPEGEDGHYGGKKWGATAIIRSMTTEYGRGTAHYGDFGRYVFQSAFRHWKVDYDGLSNYAIQKIFELGYDPELFSEFDSQQGTGRGSGHTERIGKKYQWIIFYELLAKVSDNYELLDESHWGHDDKTIPFDGPWNPYVRDCDPTMVIKKTFEKNDFSEIKNTPWWISVLYNNWDGDPEIWLKDCSTYPSIKDLLEVRDGKGIDWINLHMHPQWREPKKLGEDRWSSRRKRIWYDFGSWLINESTLNRMLKVDSSKKNWQNWIPRLTNRYELFSREFNWSPAWRFFFENSYYGEEANPEVLVDPDNGSVIGDAMYTGSYFLWEEEFDCSKEDVIRFFKPSKLIAEGLNLARREGSYLNDENEVVCFDPSIYETGPSCLLIRKKHLQKILEKNNLKIVWILQGEKQFIDSRIDHSINALYYLNDDGELEGELKSYLKNYS